MTFCPPFIGRPAGPPAVGRTHDRAAPPIPRASGRGPVFPAPAPGRPRAMRARGVVCQSERADGAS
jgi:hypothetical protein